jgi:hypothetical protein
LTLPQSAISPLKVLRDEITQHFIYLGALKGVIALQCLKTTVRWHCLGLDVLVLRAGQRQFHSYIRHLNFPVAG